SQQSASAICADAENVQADGQGQLHAADGGNEDAKLAIRRQLSVHQQRPMNALRILFNTGRFNLSKVGEHFINPCCFGEDLSAWLRQKLIERLVEMREPYQEDWSWELPAKSGDQSYYLCMSGNADGSAANPDEGEG